VKGTPRRRRLIVGCVVAAVGFGVVAAWVAFLLFRQNWAVVRGLRLGQTSADVVAALGRQPDCTTAVGLAQVSYFIDSTYGNGDECKLVASRYRSTSDLPWIYSAIAVAYDRQGHVSAFVHVGEGRAVTRVNNKPDGWLNPLPLEALE
jgi:hypothetical protein